MSILHTYSAEDIRRLKKEIEEKGFPKEQSASSIATSIASGWSCPTPTLIKWVKMARCFTDETIDLLEAGKIKKSFLTKVRDVEFGHPSYKDMVARASVDYDIDGNDLPEIRLLTLKGNHPLKAIKIILSKKDGRKVVTKSDTLSVDRIVKEFERDGFAWRQRATLLKGMGKFQVIQDGTLNNRLAYTLAAMKTAVDDMKRFVDELWKDVPAEIQEAVAKMFADSPPEEPERPLCDDLLALPAPEPVEEGSDEEPPVEHPDESPELEPPVGGTEVLTRRENQAQDPSDLSKGA